MTSSGDRFRQAVVWVALLEAAVTDLHQTEGIARAGPNSTYTRQYFEAKGVCKWVFANSTSLEKERIPFSHDPECQIKKQGKGPG